MSKNELPMLAGPLPINFWLAMVTKIPNRNVAFDRFSRSLGENRRPGSHDGSAGTHRRNIEAG